MMWQGLGEEDELKQYHMSSWAVSLFETAVYIEGHPMGVKNGNHKAIHKTSRPM